MKLGILIEWEVQNGGNGKTVLGSRAVWSGQEIILSSKAFEASNPDEVKEAQDAVFGPILEKLGEKLKEGKL